MRNAYIFDIDGTLADITERLKYIEKEPKDWDSFHNAARKDKPITDTIALCAMIMSISEIDILFVTGRPESSRQVTLEWLNKNIPEINLSKTVRLYMRKDDDYRKDFIFKKEIYDFLKNKYKILGVFEDRQQCVDMWRKEGITCYQVAKGNY